MKDRKTSSKKPVEETDQHDLGTVPEKPIAAVTSDTELRILNDAKSIGASAVQHLKTMYPGIFASAPKTAEKSLAGFVNNRVASLIRSLLEETAALKAERAERPLERE